MTTSDIKLKIIERIAVIEDELVLEEIYRLVDAQSGMDVIYRLSADERKAVESGLNDINEGRVHSSEEAEKLIREWLKK